MARRFGAVVAVDDVSLRVPAGQLLAILGSSGSGKTTLLRMIAGLETVGRGCVRVGNVDISDLPPYRRDIGVVFQHHALFPHMTVAENVEYPLRMRRVPRAQRDTRVSEMLTVVGLTALSQRYPAQLSGGEQQRVALARALVFKPRILLMDEPLASLDKRSREQLQREIRALQRTLNITTVYVTHDQTEAFLLADLVAVMNAGRIDQMASPREIYESPRTEFVARFVGDSNVFTGQAVGTDLGESSIELRDGTLIRCPATLVPGRVTTLLVRPERLALQSTAVASAEINALHAVIVDILFLGESTEYRLRAHDFDIIARRQNVTPATALRKGSSVVVTWPVADTVVLS